MRPRTSAPGIILTAMLVATLAACGSDGDPPADTIAFEMLAGGAGHASLPAHRILLVETGLPIIETLDLEKLAAAAEHEFLFVLSHLNLIGATGAPVRPLAIVSSDR